MKPLTTYLEPTTTRSQFPRWVCGLLVFCAVEAFGLTFDFEYHDSIPSTELTNIRNGIEEAGQIWASHLSDDVELQVEVRWVPTFENPSEGARATVFYLQKSFTEVRDALEERSDSAADRSSLSHLTSDETVSFLLNKTSDNPNGPGSDTPYLDDNGNKNNKTMRVSLGNAKLLGLLPSTLNFKDGRITISGRPDWDYDPSNGVTVGQADFLGLCLHEIGHILGMNSLIDSRLAAAGGKADTEYAYLTPLDLFRFSRESVSAGGTGTPDWSSDGREKFFSIDGGQNITALFSLGVFQDRYDPSHWKRDEVQDGIFEPTVQPEVKISNADRLALDVIGWTLTEEVPVFEDVVASDESTELTPLQTKVQITSMDVSKIGILIQWGPINGAGRYRVYGCDFLGGDFTLLPNGETTRQFWTGLPHEHAHCFFNIVAYE